MIQVKDLIHLKEYWYCSLVYSSNSFRVIKKKKPIKVIFYAEEKSSRYELEGVFKTVDSKTVVSRINKYSVSDDDIIYNMYLTEEDCIEGYNAIILNQLDKLQEFYERKKSYLNKNLLKIKKERD